MLATLSTFTRSTDETALTRPRLFHFRRQQRPVRLLHWLCSRQCTEDRQRAKDRAGQARRRTNRGVAGGVRPRSPRSHNGRAGDLRVLESHPGINEGNPKSLGGLNWGQQLSADDRRKVSLFTSNEPTSESVSKDGEQTWQGVAKVDFTRFSAVISQTKSPGLKVFFSALQCAAGITTGAATGGVTAVHALTSCGSLVSSTFGFLAATIYKNLENAQFPADLLAEIGYSMEYSAELKRILNSVAQGGRSCYNYQTPPLIDRAYNSLCAVRKTREYAAEQSVGASK